MMKLKNYAPAGNEILLQLIEYSTSAAGVVLVKPDQEKVMRVLKVGPTVTILNPLTGQTVKPGDFAMPMSPNMLQFEFLLEDGSKISAVQTKEFGIASFYAPDKDETKFFAVSTSSPEDYSKTRDLNIIDNPGLENSSYLKEERENNLKLATE